MFRSKRALILFGLGLVAAGCSNSKTSGTAGSTGGLLHRTSTNTGSGSGGGTSTGGTGTTGSTTSVGGTVSGTGGGAPCGRQCVAPYPLCAPQGQCVQCLSDANCSGTPADAKCVTDPANLAYGSCVACLASSDCDGGVCHPVTLTCVSDCRTSDAGCTTNVQTPLCDPSSGACVQCIDDSQCGRNFGPAICVQNTCQNCSNTRPCPVDGGAPYCNLEGACVPCQTNADCDGGTCNYPTPGTCQ